MSFTDLVATVESSDTFKDFKKKNPEAFLCTGFFIIDFLTKSNKNTIDYKTDTKIVVFSLENDEIQMQEDDILDVSGKALTKIESFVKIEVEELRGIAGIEILEKGYHQKFQKLIAILQNYNGEETHNEQRLIWNLTCLLDNLMIVHILVDASSGEILKFEKKNFMDFVRKN